MVNCRLKHGVYDYDIFMRVDTVRDRLFILYYAVDEVLSLAFKGMNVPSFSWSV